MTSTTTQTDMGDDKRKHLEFIQNIITRMNSNSFMIKGWAVTIVSAILALFASTKNLSFLFITLLPILVFWLLDARYLQMERKFRSLYREVAKIPSSVDLYDMNFEHQSLPKDPKNRLWNTFRSDTIFPFYFFLAVLAALCITFMYLLKEPKDTIMKVSIDSPIKIKSMEATTTKSQELIKSMIPDTLKITK